MRGTTVYNVFFKFWGQCPLPELRSSFATENINAGVYLLHVWQVIFLNRLLMLLGLIVTSRIQFVYWGLWQREI